MYPINGNITLLPELKKRGFKLYYLSNFPDDIFDEVFNGYEFFKFFDGGLISSRVKCIKPDIKIFEIIIEKYSLSKNECLFIDDIEINTKAAQFLELKVSALWDLQIFLHKLKKFLLVEKNSFWMLRNSLPLPC